jgi:hypothetical protein
MNNLHVCGVVRRTDAEYSAIASFVVGTNGRLEEEGEEEEDGRPSPTATKMTIKIIFYLLIVEYVYVCNVSITDSSSRS